MFIPAPNACGRLENDIAPLDNVIVVDYALWAYLGTRLGQGVPGNQTYLRLSSGHTTEYIRVDYVSDTPGELAVLRGIDSSERQVHVAGTEIEYVLTAAAVLDLVESVTPVTLNITADPPLTITSTSINTFHIAIDPLTLGSSNNTVLISGAWPNIDLVTNPTGAGCCG